MQPVILASDKTHLTNFSGDKPMHAIYLSLGNISKEKRKQPSSGAWILLAELPTEKFVTTKFANTAEAKKMSGLLKRQRFHKCLRLILAPLQAFHPSHDPSCLIPAIDSEGYLRQCFPVLMAWIADLEEQWDILGLAKNSCPKCHARFKQLDDAHLCDARSGYQTVATLHQIRRNFPQADAIQFMREAKRAGLNGVEELCWEGLAVDICRAICVDPLHTYHKMFGDHLMLWVSRTVGKVPLDARFAAQPHRIGAKNFSTGISHLSQLTGKEYRDMERHLAPVIAGHANATPQVLKSVRGLLDFIFKALFPLHSDSTLALMQHDLEIFRRNRTVFILNGSRTIKNAPAHMRIPKLHYLPHTASNIRDLGTTDNFSTETCESLHITHCKNAYKATNRRAFRSQIIQYLIRQESLSLYSNYMSWLDASPPNAMGEGNSAEPHSDIELDVDASLQPPQLPVKSIAHAKRPQYAAVPVDSIVAQLAPVGIISPMIRYFVYGDNGSVRRSSRAYYDRRQLPAALELLDVWNSFTLSFDRPNNFYPQQSAVIHCKPAKGDKAAVFDTVLVEVDPSQKGLRR